MHFQPELNPNQNTITACGADGIKINHILHTSAVIVTPDEAVQNFEASSPSDLTRELFEQIAKVSPEVVLVGTGARQTFLPPAQLSPLIAARIGVECMGSDAAARTYNVLMGEGRRVLAVMLVPK